MKKIFFLFLVAGSFIATAQIQKNNKSVLTIEKIMQDPAKWIGTSPENIYWSEKPNVFFSTGIPKRTRFRQNTLSP